MSLQMFILVFTRWLRPKLSPCYFAMPLNVAALRQVFANSHWHFCRVTQPQLWTLRSSWRLMRRIDIHSMAKTENEILLCMVNPVAANLGVAELTEVDVEAVHKLPSKDKIVSGIIVCFSRHETQFSSKKISLRTAVPFSARWKNERNRQVTSMSGTGITKFLCLRQMENPPY